MTQPLDNPSDVMPEALTRAEAEARLLDIQQRIHNLVTKKRALQRLAAQVALSTVMSKGDKADMGDHLTRLLFEVEANI
jgi:hypothetical protein